MSVSEASVPSWEAPDWDLRDVPAEFVDRACIGRTPRPAGTGILLAAILGLLLWLVIILATGALVRAA